ncbi:hypothetical protein LOD99_14637 [Oopsacas minuta]|uniref:TRAF1-6 MATH domain-containing protein n=1 Tax=Oopsacas minuta TaxID=111878 RepID=A0AAV7KF06_9METZ|nr:hypothetical protein LOD99_14637 [Oopsacas minuta]
MDTDKVGVYIYIMKGAYDDNLHWHIRYKFTFILLNHINSNNNYELTSHVTKEYLEKYPNSLKRPTELRNMGFGTSLLISNIEILEANIVKKQHNSSN